MKAARQHGSFQFGFEWRDFGGRRLSYEVSVADNQDGSYGQGEQQEDYQQASPKRHDEFWAWKVIVRFIVVRLAALRAFRVVGHKAPEN